MGPRGLTVKFAQPAAAVDGVKAHTQNTAGHAVGQDVTTRIWKDAVRHCGEGIDDKFARANCAGANCGARRNCEN
jgi:hypothetical protein